MDNYLKPSVPIFLKKQFSFLLCIGIALNATCLFNGILEPDGALYASIAKHIALTNDWVTLWGNGSDWLDKPHLPFWITAVSFKLLGINSFSYKLPSVLCWLVGVWYCYKLSESIYNTAVAQVSTIIYITALHVILSNFDVRAEGYLTTFIVAATYHIYKAMGKRWLLHIILAAIFCACAIMVKGIFTVVTIVSGFMVYWIYKKQWNEFLKWKWYLFAILSFIFILPELYCLYMQFDLHPEKIVFGKTNVSGIRFFFWDSQFGRFFNNGPIKGKGDKFFFLHTTIWAFLPWAFLLAAAVVSFFSKKKNSPLQNEHSLIIGSSALITFLMFSFSKFQLPHYIVIVFPHLAMITAAWMLHRTSESTLKKWNVAQTVLYLLLIVATIAISLLYVFSNAGFIFLSVSILIVSLFAFLYKTKSPVQAIIKKNIAFALLLAIFLNCVFYPSLLQYQSGMTAGIWTNENYASKPVTMLGCNSFTFEFYCKGNVARADSISQSTSINPADTLLLYVPFKDVAAIKQNNPAINIETLKTFDYFHVSQLKLDFLRSKTRASTLDTFAIAMVTKKAL